MAKLRNEAIWECRSVNRNHKPLINLGKSKKAARRRFYFVALPIRSATAMFDRVLSDTALSPLD